MTEIGTNQPEYTVRAPGRWAVTLGWAAATDTGLRRKHNEDSVLARAPIFAVADGMGGHAAGDYASNAVVTRLSERITTETAIPADIDSALRDAVEDIALISGNSLLGTGTTATGVALTELGADPCFLVFNIGDSRVYRWQSGRLGQITVDHSVVQTLVDAGTITREQAERHPDSNIITRAVGFNVPPVPDYWTLPAEPGLRLLVCSDGLNKELSDRDIALHLQARKDADTTARALVRHALEQGGRDNVTVIVLDVLAVESDPDLECTMPKRQR